MLGNWGALGAADLFAALIQAFVRMRKPETPQTGRAGRTCSRTIISSPIFSMVT